MYWVDEAIRGPLGLSKLSRPDVLKMSPRDASCSSAHQVRSRMSTAPLRIRIFMKGAIRIARGHRVRLMTMDEGGKRGEVVGPHEVLYDVGK